MYTIEELESLVNGRSNAVDITDIVDQLLDTLKRIEAAAAIAEVPFPEITRSGFPEAFTNGANEMRAEFRRALELEP